MNRTGWLAAALLGVLGVGTWSALRWPSPRPALPCAPSQVVWEGGVARCADPEERLSPAERDPVPAGQAMTLGRRLDLNTATAEDLALVPGVGARLARTLVEARERQGGFESWEEVDALPGVGPARLEALQEAAEIPGGR